MCPKNTVTSDQTRPNGGSGGQAEGTDLGLELSGIRQTSSNLGVPRPEPHHSHFLHGGPELHRVPEGTQVSLQVATELAAQPAPDPSPQPPTQHQ